MIHIFSFREIKNLSTGVLLRAEAEYTQAYQAACYHQSSAAAAFCQELEHSLSRLRDELRSRGIEPNIDAPARRTAG